MDHKVELLAPAGNIEGFYGAVHAGADAVYLGGQRFGARAYADNFTEEEILACIRYAHIWGRRVYLTVNTLVKEKEFEELPVFLKPLYEGGLDGVIVQDLGVFAVIRDHFPGLKLHASTQMTLTGRYGAALLKEMGADRIVPARELGLSEIKEIKAASGLEIETFIHGAMCYCYSGQCLFSSILGGRSGNRGRCAQPCRLPYRVERDGRTTGECYPLSLKDMCTIERIPQLVEAGIDSFKIEGRMKKPEYAAGVTAVYRKYIDRYYEGGAGGKLEIEQADLDALASLYIRSGRQDGYYFRRNGRDMVTLDSPSYSGSDEGLLSAVRERYLGQKPKRNIAVRAEFKIGRPAEVWFTAERDGRRIEAFAAGEPVLEAVKQPVTRENIAKQLGKLGDTSFQADPIEIESDERIFYPLKAVNELRRQAAGLLENALIEENGFCVKRDAEPAVRSQTPETAAYAGKYGEGLTVQGGRKWHLSVRTGEQFAAAADFWKSAGAAGADRTDPAPALGRLYLEADLFLNADAAERDGELFLRRCRELRAAGCELVLALPHILRASDEEWLERLWRAYRAHRDLFSGFLARSMDGLGYLRGRCAGEEGIAVYADAGIPVWNRNALQALCSPPGGGGPECFCLPYELNAGEQRRLLEGNRIPCEKIVYGRIPLMITANCAAKTIDGCRNSGGREWSGAEDGLGRWNGIYYLTDRLGKRFPVVCDCRHCMNLIYNSLPLSLHRETEKWRERVSLRIDLTIESGEEALELLRFFMTGSADSPSYEYTTGHEKRGTE